MDKCPGCSKAFVNGDQVIRVNLERVMAGEKSGALGFYDHQHLTRDEPERIHFSHSCIEKYFSPIENPFYYDFLAEQVRAEIYQDEKDRDEFELPNPMDEDPPYCLWCKKEETVWLQQQRDLWIFFCTACQKLWDQDEYELVFDPQKGYCHVE